MAVTFSTLGKASAVNGTLHVSGALSLADGITAPTNVSGKAYLYVDTADGDLKVLFGDNFGAVVKADS